MDQQSYLEIYQTRGLVRILGEGWDRLAAVPEREIDAIRALQASRLPGQRPTLISKSASGSASSEASWQVVRVSSFARTPAKASSSISVNLLQRSVAVEIDCTLVVAA